MDLGMKNKDISQKSEKEFWEARMMKLEIQVSETIRREALIH